jgi:hypothetical protein
MPDRHHVPDQTLILQALKRIENKFQDQSEVLEELEELEAALRRQDLKLDAILLAIKDLNPPVSTLKRTVMIFGSVQQL